MQNAECRMQNCGGVASQRFDKCGRSMIAPTLGERRM